MDCLVPAVVLSLAQTLAAALDSDDDSDGRSHRQPLSRRFSMQQSLFSVADSNIIFNGGRSVTSFVDVTRVSGRSRGRPDATCWLSDMFIAIPPIGSLEKEYRY